MRKLRKNSRIEQLQGKIAAWDDFVIFQIVDNMTIGKDPRPVDWFLKKIGGTTSTELRITEFFNEISAAMKTAPGFDNRRSLVESIRGDINSQMAPVFSDSEQPTIREFLGHLSRYCTKGIDGFCANARFELPPGWEDALGEILKDSIPRIKSQISPADEVTLATSGAQVDISSVDPLNFDVRQVGLTRDMLGESKDYHRLLLQSLSFKGSNLVPEEMVPLGKLVVAIADSIEQLKPSSQVGSTILLCITGAITKFSEDRQ